jgi:hypothetical protein
MESLLSLPKNRLQFKYVSKGAAIAMAYTRKSEARLLAPRPDQRFEAD